MQIKTLLVDLLALPVSESGWSSVGKCRSGKSVFIRAPDRTATTLTTTLLYLRHGNKS